MSIFIKKIFRYFEDIKINRFINKKNNNYPEIEYKHYLRMPKIWLRRKLKVNEKSLTLKKILKKRRSIRKFIKKKISFKQLNYIIVNSLGITEFKSFYRAYPSGGARYPIETYLILFKPIDKIEPGIYHYNPLLNCLEKIDKKVDLEEITFRVFGIEPFPNTYFYLFFTAIPNRQIWKYYTRTLGLMYLEAGHMAQNIYLTSLTQGIGCCALGGFIEEELIKILKIRKNYEYPIYALALGKI